MSKILDFMKETLSIEYDRRTAIEKAGFANDGDILVSDGFLISGDDFMYSEFINFNLGIDSKVGDTLISPMYLKDWGALLVIETTLDKAMSDKEVDDRECHEVILGDRYFIVFNKNNKNLLKYYLDGDNLVNESISASEVSKLIKRPKIFIASRHYSLTKKSMNDIVSRFYKKFMGLYVDFQSIRSGNPLIKIEDVSFTGPRLKRDFLAYARSTKFNSDLKPILNSYDLYKIRNDKESLMKIKSKLSGKGYFFYSIAESNDNGILILYIDKNNLDQYIESSSDKITDLGIHIDTKGKIREFYILKNGEVMQKKFSKYISITASNHSNLNDIRDSEIMKWKNEILDDINERTQDGFSILELATMPIYESIYKLGFKDIVIKHLQRNFDVSKSASKAISGIEYFFGELDLKEDKINQILGLNKSQIKFFSEVENQRIHTPNNYKYILANGGKINNISEKEFNLIKEVLEGFYKEHLGNINRAKFINSKILIDLLKLAYDCHGLRGISSVKIYLDEVKYSLFFIEHLWSYYSMYSNLKEELPQNYKISIESIEDLNGRIAELTYLQGFLTREIVREEFKKSVKNYEHLEDKGSKYSIITPNDPIELINEGSELKHCVASYVDKVSSGETKILFVRDNEDLEKPLYTLEVGKRNKIVQLRGQFNITPPAEVRDYVENVLNNASKK